MREIGFECAAGSVSWEQAAESPSPLLISAELDSRSASARNGGKMVLDVVGRSTGFAFTSRSEEGPSNETK